MKPIVILYHNETYCDILLEWRHLTTEESLSMTFLGYFYIEE